MSSCNLLPIVATVVCCFSVLIEGLVPVQPAASADEKRDATDGRLPRDVTPFHYDIEIAPDFYGSLPFPFTGSIVIFVRCDVPSSSITLNSKSLTIESISIEIDRNSSVPSPPPELRAWELNAAADFLTLELVNPLVLGATYVVRISYSGFLRDAASDSGIYYDYYTDSRGNTRYVVATQLESIYARLMYPCFDEPDLKATFSVVVLRKEPMISLSNMNQLRTEQRPNGWLADFYAESPIMSTYQVCVCVGEFQFIETEWNGVTSIPVRIYGRAEMISNLAFAAQIAPVFQAWLEQETGIPYNLPKMDHIALPSKGGAMENWGLITYGEPSICINSETSGATGKMNVASIVAHELAHQWYGNIVTCKWWNDVWLNEGFATNYNYYPPSSIGWPSSESQQSDPRRGTQQFLDLDQRNNSDPVRKQIDTVWQGPGSFSGSTYPKGGAIVRMLKGLMPEPTLKRAFTKYLNEFSYDSATTDDLWNEINEQATIDGVTNPDGSALDVKTIMDPWLNQMGYPLLRVTSAGDGTAVVTTQRFFNPRGQTPDIPSSFNYEWNVPINIATAATINWDNVLPSFYVNIGESSVTIDGLPVGENEWFVINPKQIFFYRVDYDVNTRAAIVNQLLTNNTRIPSESRSSLIDDSFSLSRSLVIPETLALETTRYLDAELRFSPWNVALKHLLYADKIFQNYAWYPTYQTYVTSKLVPVYTVTGWDYADDLPAIDQFLQREILSTTCFYGGADCRNVARDQYNIYHLRPEINSVASNNLPTVLCLGVNEEPNTEWVLVFNQYLQRRSSPINEERYAYLYGMACTTEQLWLDTYLNYIIRGEQIATRDQTTALNYLVQNVAGRQIVWNYFRNSWTTVPSTIGKFTVLRNIVSTWYRSSDLNNFNDFVTTYPPSNESQRNLLVQMNLLIQQNIEWIAANANEIEQWLAAQLPLSGGSVQQLSAPLPVSPLALQSTLLPDNFINA